MSIRWSPLDSFWKIMSFLNWRKSERRTGSGERGKEGRKFFSPTTVFSETIFCLWNKLHKYVIYGRYCSCHATMRAKGRRKYILCYDIDLLRAEKPALHDPDSCVSLQPIELTPGSWSNFYCHEGVIDSHLRVFIRLEYNIAWSIYWMYMGLYSHLVSSHNYYSHYPVISWGSRSQRTWQKRLSTHTHTHRWKYLPKCVTISFSSFSCQWIYHFLRESALEPGIKWYSIIFSHTLVITFLITH